MPAGATCPPSPDALAARYEAALARDPARLDLLARLGRLYEAVLRDEVRAERCHCLHLVRSGGFASECEAEAALWTRVAGGVATPAERLALGHLLAFRGRREEARVHLAAGTVLYEVATAHFVFRAVPGSAADAAMAAIAAEREAGIAYLAELFALEGGLERPIRCTFYESRLHKEAVTGDGMPAHTLVAAAEMHLVWGPLLQVRGVHEDAHVLLGTLGRGSKLLEEGAAMFADRGAAVHLELAERLRTHPRPALAALADDAVFAAADADLAYPLAGSFAAFLVERAGIAGFKRLYPQRWPALDGAMRAVCGATIDELETEWLRQFPALAERAREATA